MTIENPDYSIPGFGNEVAPFYDRDFLITASYGSNPGIYQRAVYLIQGITVADFDDDRDVDGADFLIWQCGESPNPLSTSDLADWLANFGTEANPIVAAPTAVPEPMTGLLLMLGIVATLFCPHISPARG